MTTSHAPPGKGADVSSGQYQQQELKVQIRWMIRRDMNEVLEIERDSFDFHWTEEDFLCCLRQRNCIGMVAEHAGEVVGFMIYELHKTRLHILNFAVAADFCRSGIGTQMIDKLVSKLSQQRRKEIMLEVRETNLSAQLFFQDQGFLAMGVLRDHYDDSQEDAYLMSYRSDTSDLSGMHLNRNRISKYESL